MLCSSWAIACACALLQYLIVCAARPSRQGFSLPPCQCSYYPQSFHLLSAYLAMDRSLHLVRERSTLRHYLLTGIRVTESCTPGPRPMPPSAILISHTYTNVPFFLCITCASFKWSFELNLARTLCQYHYEALAAGHDAGLRLSCL